MVSRMCEECPKSSIGINLSLDGIGDEHRVELQALALVERGEGEPVVVGSVVASVVAGALFQINMSLPFVFFVVGIAASMIIGLLLYRTLPSAKPT